LVVLLDGEDVADLIRTPEVSQMASKVSALRVVRDRMLELQRGAAAHGDIVAEGRDIGTVIFPKAEVKIYLDASVEERARRRFQELRTAGRKVSLNDTSRELEERDQRDSGRDLAPLCKAADATVIDSSALPADAVAERVMALIRSELNKDSQTK
jgi:cytidylate kinase